MSQLLKSPKTYLCWLILVSLIYLVTYFASPVWFALLVVCLGLASLVVASIGCYIAFIEKPDEGKRRILLINLLTLGICIAGFIALVGIKWQ